MNTSYPLFTRQLKSSIKAHPGRESRDQFSLIILRQSDVIIAYSPESNIRDKEKVCISG